MGMFVVSDSNPNDVAGGGGCLCAPTKLPHAGGPYLVFSGTEQVDPGSPYVVLCVGCANQGVRAISDETDAGNLVARATCSTCTGIPCGGCDTPPATAPPPPKPIPTPAPTQTRVPRPKPAL